MLRAIISKTMAGKKKVPGRKLRNDRPASETPEKKLLLRFVKF